MDLNELSGNTRADAPRADARQVTPAEGRAFATLLEEIGFAPNVMFGRDATNYPLWFQRLVAGKVYALVPNIRGPNSSTDVTKYTLYVATVTSDASAGNGTVKARGKRWRSKDRRAEWTPERRAKMSRRMKELWATKKTPEA